MFYTIQQSDVGKRTIRAFGGTWSLTSVLGVVQTRDVGKRIYLKDGILSVENDQQRDSRILIPGASVSWLHHNKIGRALTGTIEEIGDIHAIVKVTSWESKRDAGKVGSRYLVPRSKLQGA